MLEMRRQRANHLGALRIHCIILTTGRRDIMSFVNHQQIEATRIDRLSFDRQKLTEESQWTLSLKIIHRGYQSRKMIPGIDVNSAFSAQQLHRLAVNDAEF